MLERRAKKLDAKEEHYWIPSPHPGLQLFLSHLPPKQKYDHPRVVLYVHGATFPSALSIAHRFDDYSWRDCLCEAGFDVWGVDFHGFGHSDRYLEMEDPPNTHPPLCRAPDASAQIGAAVQFILDHHSVKHLSIIAHSWGTVATGRFAGEHPSLIDRLILFAPISHRPARRYETPPPAPAWRIVTLEDQWSRFVEDVPDHETPVLSRKHFDEWGDLYLDTDADSRSHDPVGVKIPTGPFTDIIHAWNGQLAYDPSLVQSPVAIIRGEWDGLVPDHDARWLFDAFTASPIKRDIKIGRGTHLMHLEAMRFALYRETNAFLLGDDRASVP